VAELAFPGNRDDPAVPASGRPASSRIGAAFGAIGTLRALLVGSIVAPLLFAAIGGYFSLRAAQEHAAVALAEDVAVAAENTTKILDTHALVAARIDDLLAGLSDGQIRMRERALHERIAQQVQDLPQVAAAWAIDGAGHALVSARVFPVDRELEHSAREDFRALQRPGIQTVIWALRARSLEGGDFQPYFTASRRRQAADGSFAGIIVVAVSGDYFASFFHSLLGGSTQYAASVLREDGSSLARFPQAAARPFAAPHDRLLAKAIADRDKGGIIAGGSSFDPASRVIAYKRLASYPVYVAIGRTRSSILWEWLESIVGYAAIGVPAAIGFMLLTLMALRRTQREQAALGEAHDAIAQRVAVETQLHQEQRARMTELSATNVRLERTIAELQEAKLAAEAASKAKSNFLANMSHELRTPLNAIIGFSDVMRSEVLGPMDNPTYREYASDIHFSGSHLLEIINDILDVVRQESGKMDLREEPVAVGAVIGEAFRLIAPEARRGTVELRWRPPVPPLPALFCDRVRLRQMLLNLLSNAVKFTGPGGSVEIRAELRGGELQLIVSDSGIGIKPEDISRIMTPFGQVASVYSRSHQGTGLGLTLTKALVERHGGRLTFYSVPNVGTTVRLSFPAERVLHSPPEVDAAVGDGPGC